MPEPLPAARRTPSLSLLWRCAPLAVLLSACAGSPGAVVAPVPVPAAEEFCLRGNFNLGARYQGMAMPADRLAITGRRVALRPVRDKAVLPDHERTVEVLAMGGSPHVAASLGVHVPAAKVRDVALTVKQFGAYLADGRCPAELPRPWGANKIPLLFKEKLEGAQ